MLRYSAAFAYSLATVALVVALLPPAARVYGQNEPASENLLIGAPKATTWLEGTTNIVQLDGPVTIQLDQTRLSAEGAVIWLTPVKGAVLEEQHAEISLIGKASLQQPDGISQSGERLFVTAVVRGTIRVTAAERAVRNLSDSELYKQAVTFRPIAPVATTFPTDENWLLQRPWMMPAAATQPAPATQPAITTPLGFSADRVEGVKTRDDLVAFVLTGNVKLFQRRPNDEFLELQADRAVLFTPLKSLRQTDQSKMTSPEDAVTGAYLEGDVRIVHTPPMTKRKDVEQRLTGNRVFYDFTTDRAILTQAVVHTIDAKSRSPLIIRAETVRQLSEGEYTATRAVLTSSSFATPSFSIGLSKAYIRQIDTGDPRLGTYSEFYGSHSTLDIYNVPVFYMPYTAGTFTEKGALLRDIEVKSSRQFGPSLVTQWGLFETLGKIPPQNVDITYQVDYFGKRGPAVGAGGTYEGGFITETTKEPWSFVGDFNGLFIEDHGKDDLGRRRMKVKPITDNRGRLDLHHEQFLPDDWEVQVELGYSSDPTFLEQWYPNDFYTRQPEQTSIYLKRQRDTESLTFLAAKQFNNFVTASDNQQEQAEVERLPEIGYHRIGDSFAADSLTFFSDNSASALDFKPSHYTLAQQGFTAGESPGLPSFGQTGEPTNIVYRADFRQEVDYPFSAGQFRFVPYVLGRYTFYSDSPTGATKNRVFAGTGVRINTAFWKVDDTVESELFDLHRLRHVVEPEVHVFTSAQNVDRTHLFIYDEPIDAINDVTGAQLALRQRWETKRGGPGRWRSVDFFTLNVEANFFTHKPNDTFFGPSSFRGLFFDSLPEASIPRNSLNADALWRVSDTTSILSDVQYNLDTKTLATASGGMAVQRGERLTYFIGQRYIQPLNSNITTFAANYELSTKYTVGFRQSFDFGLRREVSSDITFLRHFDRFYAALTLRYDEVGSSSGFMFNIYPEGLGKASAGTAALTNVVR